MYMMMKDAKHGWTGHLALRANARWAGPFLAQWACRGPQGTNGLVSVSVPYWVRTKPFRQQGS
jgi:hypothetical protein